MHIFQPCILENISEVNNKSESHVAASTNNNNRRLSMPKSPENKLASPRLCLKFQRDNHGHLNQKFKDSKEPQYKSYSVTNVSLESTLDPMFSPVDSPASSADSDLYNPHLDGIGNLNFNKARMAITEADTSKGRPQDGESNVNPSVGRSNARELFPSQGVVNGRRNLDNHHGVFSSVKENMSELENNSVTLKHMETKPFIPSAQWSDSQNDNLELTSFTSSLSSLSSSLPTSGSAQVLDSESAGCNSVSSSSSLHCVSHGELGPHTSMVTSTTGSNNISLVTNSIEKDKETPSSGLSNSTSMHSGICNSNTGTNSLMNVAESSTVTSLKWELRSASSPKSEDNVVPSSQQRSDSFSAGSPFKPDKDKDSKLDKESRPSTPKVPPLKIIIPTKSQASSSTDSNEGLKLVVTNVKSALPYVINPYQDQGREAEAMESGEIMSQTRENSNSVSKDQLNSQESTHKGVVAETNKVQESSDSDKNVDVELDCAIADSTKSNDRLNDREESKSDKEDNKSDSDSIKRDDKKEEPTQRVLRSAVRSQQTDSAKPTKQKSVDKTDRNSKYINFMYHICRVCFY